MAAAKGKQVITPYPPISWSVEHWQAISPKQRWDVVTALRGPDLVGSRGTLLKFITSAVIRHTVRAVVKPKGGSALMNSVSVIMLPVGMKAAPFAVDHFLGHIQDAADILDLPRCYVTGEVFNKVVAEFHHDGLGALQSAMVNLCKYQLELGDSLGLLPSFNNASLQRLLKTITSDPGEEE